MPKELVANLDEFLEETICPVCGHIGMSSDGSFDWVCPICGDIGTINSDSESLNYFYDESVSNLDQDEKGEVWDGYDD
jgi:tRNA(Ile2) C34 agmatinyltransferase TiaS